MKILVDSSVWSLALRRNAPDPMAAKALSSIILASQVVIIGPIRQEVLSGISNEAVFSRLKSTLEHFDDLSIGTFDYETAARFNNICRKNGVQGSHIDFLICAVAVNNGLHILSFDRDFELFAKYLSIQLYAGGLL